MTDPSISTQPLIGPVALADKGGDGPSLFAPAAGPATGLSISKPAFWQRDWNEVRAKLRAIDLEVQDSRELAWFMCHEENNVDACAYFVTRFCRVTDDGVDSLIPDWDFVLEDCSAFGEDVHDEKTRQMLATWLTVCQHLWRMMTVKNVSGFFMSRKEKLVDDGGDGSTTHSMFGRMRHIYNNLPDWMRERSTVKFSKLRATCDATGSFVTGDGTTDNPGRGNTIGRVDADEAAHIPGIKWYSALRRACPHGFRMRSTPNGKDNKFWQIKFETRGKFVFLRKHWTRHPARWDGVERDAEGNPTSQYYRDVCSDMNADEIGREIDISYEHSVAGQVLPEYDEDVHLTPYAVYDPNLPLWADMDFGGGAATTCLLSQGHGREWWWIADYEAWNGDVDDHAPAIWATIQAIGFQGEMKDVVFHGDPAGNAKELTNKNSTVIRAYRTFGFENFQAAPRKPVKDRIRLMRRKLKRRHIQINSGLITVAGKERAACQFVRKRITDYRYRCDDMGNVLPGEVIVENAAVHMMDGCGYGAISHYPVDEGYDAGMVTVPVGAAHPQPKDWARDVAERTDGSWQRSFVGGMREY